MRDLDVAEVHAEVDGRESAETHHTRKPRACSESILAEQVRGPMTIIAHNHSADVWALVDGGFGSGAESISVIAAGIDEMKVRRKPADILTMALTATRSSSGSSTSLQKNSLLQQRR